MVSILLALIHAVIEIIFLKIESQEVKTTFLHYSIICFNGRFGWVPFLENFTSTKRKVDSSKPLELDYECLQTNYCCAKFNLEYHFGNDSLAQLTKAICNLPMAMDEESR